MVHGNETGQGKGAIGRTAMSSARQRGSRAHGKEKRHGKERSQRTAKKHYTAKAGPVHGKKNSHGKKKTATAKVALPCGRPLPCAYKFFNFFFISVLFFLLLMFISQLVLYFVDYILVLLNTFGFG
jgi:hypothetical protein